MQIKSLFALDIARPINGVVKAADGFQRPGDAARFVVVGSGFQPQDAAALKARVDGFGFLPATFTYVSAGRMELLLSVPLTAATFAPQAQWAQTLSQFLNRGNWIYQLLYGALIIGFALRLRQHAQARI